MDERITYSSYIHFVSNSVVQELYVEMEKAWNFTVYFFYTHWSQSGFFVFVFSNFSHKQAVCSRKNGFNILRLGFWRIGWKMVHGISFFNYIPKSEEKFWTLYMVNIHIRLSSV